MCRDYGLSSFKYQADMCRDYGLSILIFFSRYRSILSNSDRYRTISLMPVPQFKTLIGGNSPFGEQGNKRKEMIAVSHVDEKRLDKEKT